MHKIARSLHASRADSKTSNVQLILEKDFKNSVHVGNTWSKGVIHMCQIWYDYVLGQSCGPTQWGLLWKICPLHKSDLHYCYIIITCSGGHYHNKRPSGFREEDFQNFVNVFLLLSNYLKGKGLGSLFEQSWLPFTKGYFVPSLVDIGSMVLRKKIFKFC